MTVIFIDMAVRTLYLPCPISVCLKRVEAIVKYLCLILIRVYILHGCRVFLAIFCYFQLRSTVLTGINGSLVEEKLSFNITS
jgi:hypothetical protein